MGSITWSVRGIFVSTLTFFQVLKWCFQLVSLFFVIISFYLRISSLINGKGLYVSPFSGLHVRAHTHSLMQTAAHRHRTFLGNYAVTDKGTPDWIVSSVHDEELTPGEEVVE